MSIMQNGEVAGMTNNGSKIFSRQKRNWKFFILLIVTILLLAFKGEYFSFRMVDNLEYLALSRALLTNSIGFLSNSPMMSKINDLVPMSFSGCNGRWMMWVVLDENEKAHELFQNKICSLDTLQRKTLLAKWVLNYAKTYVDAQQLSRAESIYNIGLTLDVLASDILKDKGYLYWVWGRDDDAIATYRAAEQADPQKSALFNCFIGMIYLKSGRLDLARTALEYAWTVQQSKPSFLGYQTSQTLIALGEIALQERQFPLAEDYLLEAQSFDPDKKYGFGFELLIDLGQAAAGMGDLERALSLYQASLQFENHPNDISVAHGVISGIYQEQGLLNKAIAEADLSIKADPQNKWAHLIMARLLDQLGQCSKAQQEYKVFVEIDPTDEYVQANLDIFVANCKPAH